MTWHQLIDLLVVVGVVLVVLGLIVFTLEERRGQRRQRQLEQQRHIAGDAVRVKALLDQEAFQAAKAMTEAARRSQRR